jgi:hypothetical protein
MILISFQLSTYTRLIDYEDAQISLICKERYIHPAARPKFLNIHIHV